MRRHGAAIALLLGLLALLGGVSWWSLRPLPAPAAAVALRPVPTPPPARVAAPEPTPEPGTDRLRVLSVEGEVQRRGADDRWSAVRAGEELQADEAIRTRSTGRAVLGVGQGGRVEIAPRSEFSVREISRTVARVRLEEGRISATLPEGAGRLRVETRGSEAHAETTGGEFAVLSTPEGQVAVAATRGSVRLSVGAQSVVVHEGEQSVAGPGSAPSAPHAIPKTLYLKVGRPGAMVQREKQTVVRGEVAPGAVVSVNGVRAPTDPGGSFEVAVPLQDGTNTLVVEAEDALGKRRRVSLPPITVKSQVRAVKARVTWQGGGTEE